MCGGRKKRRKGGEKILITTDLLLDTGYGSGTEVEGAA